MPIPPHRARVIAILEAAGFRNREDHLPLYRDGGTFSAVGPVSVGVTVEWWSASGEELAGLLERIAATLRDAGLVVVHRGDRLYVPYVAGDEGGRGG